VDVERDRLLAQARVEVVAADQHLQAIQRITL
jgi:hypothetical protein